MPVNIYFINTPGATLVLSGIAVCDISQLSIAMRKEQIIDEKKE